MSRTSDLVAAYSREVGRAWAPGISGGERVWMLVYPPDSERQVRAALPQLELATVDTDHGWVQIDVSNSFGEWISNHRHAAAFFEDPANLTPAILDQFEAALEETICARLDAAADGDVVALIGIASIFPFIRASSVVKAIDSSVRGRLLVLFPGHHDWTANSFRLLDARDGFNYRARVIDPLQEAS